ncbi:hypothetical protein [Pseudorhodobacter wandonensis]|nr:hypothetical protein [Pseudorhodobacter wandonensis]
MTKSPVTPQQGSTPAPTSQQQGQTPSGSQQQGQTVFRDWASI